jgi:hypothetical protein
MLFITNDRGHLRRIATELTIKIDDVFFTSQIMMVPAKWRLASEEIMEKIIGMITSRTMTSATIIWMRRVPTGKIIGLGSQDHTTCHPKIC